MGSRRLLVCWAIIFSLYWLVRFLRFSIDSLPDVLAYQLTDFLFMPWLILGSTLMYRLLTKQKGFVPKVFQVLFCILGTCWYFEFYLPEVSADKHFGDWKDCVAYILGGFFSLLLLKKPTSK